MELIGSVKNYEWGKLGSKSAVADLASLNSKDFIIDENTPYSELWMGTHVSGPAIIKATGKNLTASLPFLFKILSIRKALSIQVHPNKTEAERLHKERPDIYKDPNHKPELAIALTPFLALCGFRPYKEIYEFCQELPPLKELLGGEASVAALENGTENDLRECYKKLMTSNEEETNRCIEDILKNYSKVLKSHQLLEVFESINCDFPKDVGLLSLFFLNLIRLQPGQAIFLAANEIHAYISGDCVECMACSDNVIRAGLTPKYKDVNQLISCLNYKGGSPLAKLFDPHRIDAYVKAFVPPVDDFVVMQISLPSKVGTYKLQIRAFDAILIVTQGQRKLKTKSNAELSLKRGSIVYLSPDLAPEIEFIAENNKNEEFVAFIASCNCFNN